MCLFLLFYKRVVGWKSKPLWWPTLLPRQSCAEVEPGTSSSRAGVSKGGLHPRVCPERGLVLSLREGTMLRAACFPGGAALQCSVAAYVGTGGVKALQPGWRRPREQESNPTLILASLRFAKSNICSTAGMGLQLQMGAVWMGPWMAFPPPCAESWPGTGWSLGLRRWATSLSPLGTCLNKCFPC